MFVFNWFNFCGDDDKQSHSKSFCHTLKQVKRFKNISWQQFLRKNNILRSLDKHLETKLSDFDQSSASLRPGLSDWVTRDILFKHELKSMKTELKTTEQVDRSVLPLWVRHEWKEYRQSVYTHTPGSVQVIYVTNMTSYPENYPMKPIRVVPESLLLKAKKKKRKSKRKMKVNQKF